MPEIPDLEIFSRNLEQKLKGKKLMKISVSKGLRQKHSGPALNKLYAGKLLKKVYRDGKQLRILFSNKEVMGIHLMLHGALVLMQKGEKAAHALVTMDFEDGTRLQITDFHRMANIFPEPGKYEAPDVMSPDLTTKYLVKEFAASNKSVKDLMLDQNVMRGLGNAYIDEILWEAGISPFSTSSKVPADRIKKLPALIRKILRQSEKEIMKRDPDMIGGRIRDFLRIHNSKKEKSPTGHTILKTTGSRKTYYTDEQVLYK